MNEQTNEWMNSGHLEDPITAEIKTTMLIRKFDVVGWYDLNLWVLPRVARPMATTLAGWSVAKESGIKPGTDQTELKLNTSVSYHQCHLLKERSP